MATYEDLKVLASGSAPSGSAQAVYTAPSATTAQVSMIWLNNKTGALRDIIMSYSGSSRQRIFSDSMVANKTFEISPKVPFVLQDGQKIELNASQTGSIDYVIIGRETE